MFKETICVVQREQIISIHIIGIMRRRQVLIPLFVVVLIKLMLDTGKYLTLPDAGLFVDGTNGLYVGELDTVKQISQKDVKHNALLRNLYRIGIVKKFCEDLGFSNADNTTDIRAHISNNNTVLYCRVNKCASTMILGLLKQLFDCDTECLIENAKLIKQDALHAKHKMQKSFSFLVVREPYTRIFSTYSNIFYFPKEDWLYRSTKIIRQVRDNPSWTSLKYGHDLAFAELIKYIVESYEKGLRIDEHVRPMSHKSCNPCSYYFDYIVKLETIKSDFEYLLSEWKRRHFIGNYDPNIITKLRELTLYGPVKHLFRTIPLIRNSNISLYKIFLRAWSYYQITGHVSKHFMFPFNEREISSITSARFRSYLEKAIKESAIASHDLKFQRIEALREAYSTVPKEYINRLQSVVRSDCLLFGYKQTPTVLLNISAYSSNSNYALYFKGLDTLL